MIKSITLNNLRCFDGLYTIPLDRFNLFYGYNGAGKSTLIEAIQLCITGNSDRASTKNVADLIGEIRTNGKSTGLKIELIGNQKKVLSAFKDSGSTHNSSELLEIFYGIREHHKTAKSLVSTLFSTHNLITQETIIKLLETESYSSFDQAIKELIAGHELLNRWAKIEKLSATLKKRLIEVNDNMEKSQLNLGNIEEHIKEWDSLSTEEIMKQYEALLLMLKDIKINIKYKDDNSSLSKIFNWLQGTRITIEEIKSILFETQEFSEQSYPIITIAEQKKSLLDLQNSIKEHNKAKSDLEEKNATLFSKSKELNNEIIMLNEKISMFDENELTPLKNRFVHLEFLNDWRPELLADKATQKYDHDLSKAKSKHDLLEKIIMMISELPSLDIYKAKKKQLLDYQEQLKEVNNEIDIYNAQLEEKKIHLSKLNEEYHQWQKQQDKLVTEYERLNELAITVLLEEDVSQCPTCGNKYPRKESLIKAINDHIKDIRRRHEISLPKKYEGLGAYRKETEAIQKKLDQLSVRTKELNSNVVENDKKLSKWIETLSIITNTLQILNIKTTEFYPLKDNYEIIFEEINKLDLHDMFSKEISNINNINSSIMNAWAGLRRDDYNQNRVNIIDKLDLLEEIQSYFEDEEEWSNYFNTLKQQINVKSKEKEKHLIDLKKIESTYNNTTNKIENNKKLLNEIDEKIEKNQKACNKISLMLEHIQRLDEYFISTEDVLNLKELGNGVSILSSKINALEQSFIAVINSHKNRTEHEKKAAQFKTSIDRNRKQIAIMQELNTQLNKITSLEKHIQQEWEKYSKYINELFLKFHSPPDYQEIRLNKADTLELQVVSKTGNEIKPANVLSSGQRAALAISIFCTLNLYGVKIPTIMLMDEPIQQIDDLNSLNFLDTLRWIVENSDRQLIISTANSKVAGLIRRKFSYLSDQYNELHIERFVNMPPVIKQYSCDGEIINEFLSRQSVG